MSDVTIEVVDELVVTVESGPPGPRGLPGRDGVGADGVSSDELAAVIQTHVEAPKPHPAYDSAPDFALIFENGTI